MPVTERVNYLILNLCSEGIGPWINEWKDGGWKNEPKGRINGSTTQCIQLIN